MKAQGGIGCLAPGSSLPTSMPFPAPRRASALRAEEKLTGKLKALVGPYFWTSREPYFVNCRHCIFLFSFLQQAILRQVTGSVCEDPAGSTGIFWLAGCSPPVTPPPLLVVLRPPRAQGGGGDRPQTLQAAGTAQRAPGGGGGLWDTGPATNLQTQISRRMAERQE